jgi:hypothetical protein
MANVNPSVSQAERGLMSISGLEKSDGGAERDFVTPQKANDHNLNNEKEEKG